MAKAHLKRKATRRKPARKGLLTRRELAAALSVGRPQPLHMQTVTKWEQEGLPVAQRGSKGRPSFYRELEVRAWLQLRDELAKQPGAVNLVQDRARKERAQAALAEQAFSIRIGDLLPREDVERMWAAEIAAVRTRLLALPTTLADALYRAATTDGLSGIERVLEHGVREVLLEFADQNRPLPSTPAPNGQGIAAAA